MSIYLDHVTGSHPPDNTNVPPPRNSKAYPPRKTKEEVRKIMRLKHTIDVIIEYVHYQQEHQEDTNIKKLGLYPLRCYVQGSVRRVTRDKSNF